jgi:hypothetical protein
MRRCALLFFLWAGLSGADKIKIDEAAPPTEGYKGVAPGAQALPPHPPKLPVKGRQRMIWSGFQVQNGVPTVFVELTAPPDYKVDEQKGALVVTLHNTSVPLKNNKRPLRVGAFNTAVTDVETSESGHDTRVVIKTKDPVSHRERVEAAAGGYQMLVIELPAK